MSDLITYNLSDPGVIFGLVVAFIGLVGTVRTFAIWFREEIRPYI